MLKIYDALRLKTFGIKHYSRQFFAEKPFDKIQQKDCTLCNLYKVKGELTKNKLFLPVYKDCFKSKIFILSASFLRQNEFDLLNNALLKTLNIGLKNCYFSTIVKCSNDYNIEQLELCKNYSFNEFLNSEAKIIIILGENLKNIFSLKKLQVGELAFLNFLGRKTTILLNYDAKFIVQNPSKSANFINNFTQLKDFL